MSNEIASAPNQIRCFHCGNVVVFPRTWSSRSRRRPKFDQRRWKSPWKRAKSILLVAQKSAAKDEPTAEDLYKIAAFRTCLQMLQTPDGTVLSAVEGSQRARIQSIDDYAQPLRFRGHARPGRRGRRHRDEAMRRALIAQFDQYVKLNKENPA